MAAPEAVAVMMPLQEAEDSMNERLRKEGWYLGEVTDDAATSILKTSSHTNTFIVYRSPAHSGYILSARFHVEGVEEDLIEHLPISETEEGKFQLSGQAEPGVDVIEVVNHYVGISSPALIPALGKSFETQISIPDEPPDYDKANRALQPDIAPLPKIGSIRVEKPVEAKTGSISPSSSLRTGRRHYYTGSGRGGVPSHINNPHWHRYSEYNCCHPKNCCHFCCHRPTHWNGYREVPSRKWYDPRGSGPLRVVLLLLFWLFCGCCFGCAKCCLFCIQICLYVCFYDDDD